MNNEFENNIPEELRNMDFESHNPDIIIETPLPEKEEDVEIVVAEKPRKKKKRKRRIWLYVILIPLLAGLFFGLGMLASKYVAEKFPEPKKTIQSTKVDLVKADGKELPKSDIAAITEECMPSVVAITNRSVSDVVTFFGTYEQESTSSGSGIIIGQNETELLIVTNYHVVNNSKELRVVFSSVEKKLEGKKNTDDFDDEIPTAVVKGYDSNKDLAVIAIELEDIPDEILSQIKIATIGDSTKLSAGDSVIAIGNSLGYGQSVTTGIISATDRKITIESAEGAVVTNSFIQTDAAINSGNSGGALLDMRGCLIGINSAKIATTGVEGMGYAIPISDVEEIIDDLMLRETRGKVDSDKQGFLGIEGTDVSSSESKSFGIPVGVFVSNVTKGLAAEKAGIKKGYVITEFDGYTITTIAQLQERLQYYEEGEKVPVTVQVPLDGAYKEKEITVTLSNRSQYIKD